MLTRRQLLVAAGAAGVVVVGGGAAELVVSPQERQRLLHRFGLASSPDHQVPASGSPEQRGKLNSRFMPAPVAWTISTPPKAAPAGIVYCLHGKGTDHRMGFDRIHLPDVAAAVGAPLAIAGVDGGPDSYWHRRADGSDALTMLISEFIPMVASPIGTAPAGGARLVDGWLRRVARR